MPSTTAGTNQRNKKKKMTVMTLALTLFGWWIIIIAVLVNMPMALSMFEAILGVAIVIATVADMFGYNVADAAKQKTK